MSDEPSWPGWKVAALFETSSAQPATRRSRNAPTTASSMLQQVIPITGGTPRTPAKRPLRTNRRGVTQRVALAMRERSSDGDPAPKVPKSTNSALSASTSWNLTRSIAATRDRDERTIASTLA